MKRYMFLLVICLTCFAAPAALHAQVPSGYSVNCDDGSSFDNGVEIIINQMRSGFTYTATAVGLNGFDPVLAVLDTSTGTGLCSDDASSASRYAANLPTSGRVPASNLSSQVRFNQNSNSTFADVSLVVGGYGNQTGEFILILEGMAVTSGDGAGDVFSVNLTPGMVASGVPLTLYMLTRGDGQVDPYIYEVDSNLNARSDNNGNLVACDDAGNTSLCWGNSVNLSDSSVTIATGTLPGWQYDAMLDLNISNMQLSTDRSQNYLNFAMSTSPQVTTEGQYLLVFNIGITEASSSGGGNNGGTGGNNNTNNTNNSNNGGTTGGSESGTNQSTQTDSNTGTSSGMSVSCEDGTGFDNGVEVILYDLPTGVTYRVTAIGMNGFDPVLAVLEAETGEGGCSDDDETGAEYSANLPTTGEVAASNLSSHIFFTPPGSGTLSVSLVVGGFGNASGDFLLIVEGMSIDENETAGDAISLNLTSGMVNSGDPVTVYMLTAAGSNLDPYIVQTTPDLTPLTDNSGNTIACDDAGGSSCVNTPDLSDFGIGLPEGNLPGWQYDAMLTSSLRGITLNSERTQNYYTFVADMSPATSVTGEYVLAFHISAD